MSLQKELNEYYKANKAKIHANLEKSIPSKIADETLIMDESGDRKYYTQIPNMIIDSQLSPFAIAIYIRIKRRAGETGICWETVRSLASATKMSKSQVQRAKDELMKAGLISIEKRPGERGHYAGHNIRIIDVWKQNVEMYSPVPVRDSEEIDVTCPQPVPVVGLKKNTLKNKGNEKLSIIENENNATPGFMAAKPAATKLNDHLGLIQKIINSLKESGREPNLDAVKESILLWSAEVDQHNSNSEDGPKWHYSNLDAILERYDVLTLSNDAIIGKQSTYIRVNHD